MRPWVERILLLGILVAGALAIRWYVKEPFTVAPVQDDSCTFINGQRAWFQDKIRAVRQLAQDLSGAMYATIAIKDENMRFQYDNWEGVASLTTRLGGKCTEKNTSPECILLATPDSNIAKYAQLEGKDLLEIARIRILELDTTLTNELGRLDRSAQIIGCPATALSQYTATWNTSRDVGYLPTNKLRDKLRELSPYYIDPTLLAVLLSYLIDDPRFLSRVHTVGAETGYVNDNIQTFWGITKGPTDGNADLNNYVASEAGFPANQRVALSNYNLMSVDSRWACGIHGGFAGLARKDYSGIGAVTGRSNYRYYWNGTSNELNSDELLFAFNTTVGSN